MAYSLRAVLVVLLAGLLIGLSPHSAAAAPLQYSYTGNDSGFHWILPFTSVHWQIVLSSPLAVSSPNQVVTPSSWTMSDGVDTISSAACPACVTDFAFGTDGSDNLTSWVVAVSESSTPGHPTIISQFDSLPTSAVFANLEHFYLGTTTDSDVDLVVNSSGLTAFSLANLPANVPEPASLTLLAIGLAGLGLELRKKMF